MFQEKLLTWLRSKKEFLPTSQWQVFIVLLGLLLIGAGVLTAKANFFHDQEVEILQPSPSPVSDIVVEIAGSVQKPGVYKLPNGARIEDVLTLAGGLAADADRQLLEKSLNRAAKLLDGQKLYIPASGEQTEVLSANVSSSNLGQNQNTVTISEGISQHSQNGVSINTASQAQLESLNGIGPVYAQNIIEGRPYSNIEELTTKKIIPQKTFDKIKNAISVY